MSYMHYGLEPSPDHGVLQHESQSEQDFNTF